MLEFPTRFFFSSSSPRRLFEVTLCFLVCFISLKDCRGKKFKL